MVLAPAPVFDGLHLPSYGDLQNCMHCGLCLPACPTYTHTLEEASSPRGRIALMRAVADGQLGLSENLEKELDFCLGCQACETACPAGVNYGDLLEASRNLLAEARPKPWPLRLAKRLTLGWAFHEPKRLAALAQGQRLLEALGVFAFLRWTRLPDLFVKNGTALLNLMPQASPVSSRSLLAVRVASSAGAAGRAVFMPGCIMDVCMAGTNVHAVEVLERAGYATSVPAGSSCCGALHAHSGDEAGALELARRHVDLFEKEEGWIVATAAGCGAAMKNYGYLLRADPAYAARAEKFSERVRDLSELLPPQGAPAAAGSGTRVAYQEACHLLHAQKISAQPKALLAGLPGVELVELENPGQCCGSAGTYNITQHEFSMTLLDEKVDSIASSGAKTVVSANPGCILQLRYGLKKRGLGDVQVLHLADFVHAQGAA